MLSPGTASKQVPEDSEVKDASIPSSMLLSPKPSRSNEEEDPLSPLHPVRSVKPPHKSDPHEEDEEQLFSPTLHLDKSTNTEDEPLYQEEEEVEEEQGDGPVLLDYGPWTSRQSRAKYILSQS